MTPAPWENWFRSGDISAPPKDDPEPQGMDFMLTFRGFIPAKGRSSDIHSIREAFHLQLKNLPILDDRFSPAQSGNELLDTNTRPANYKQMDMWFKWEMGGYEYVPLVQRHHEIACQFDIVWVRPLRVGAPSGSDLDNCYRNLSDALTLPKSNQMQGIGPPADPAARRRYCLLEDDSLVTGFSVKAFRSLGDVEDVSQVPNMSPREKPTAQVDLLVHVSLQRRWSVWGSSGVP